MPGVMSVPVRLSPGVDSFAMLFGQISPSLQVLDDILTVVGILCLGGFVLSTTWDLCVGLRAMVWSRLWKKNFEKRYGGKWAVVTGCTDGIGKGYANELAKDGLNIILISRSATKLQTVAGEIEKAHGVETVTIVADFTEGNTLYPKIEQHIGDRDIAVLVNNVGVMTAGPSLLHNISEKDVWAHVNVNMASLAAMTQMILPSMNKRNKGAIVNIASIAATGPIPYLGIYAASKSFVEYLSIATAHEYPKLTIQTVTPAYVSTNMTSFSKWTHTPNLLTPTAPQFAASAVSTIGYTSYTTGYWSHGVQKYFLSWLPRTVFTFLMKYMQLFLLSTLKTDDKSS